MPITSTDIKAKLSGGAANTDVAASLGGAISSTDIQDATLHNLFPEINEDQTEAGITLYKCFYFKNEHGSLTWRNVKAYISSNAPDVDVTVEIGIGTSGVNGEEQSVADNTTAPTGVTFAAPADKANGLAVGDVPFGEHFPVWVKLIVSAGAGASEQSATIRGSGGTAS